MQVPGCYTHGGLPERNAYYGLCTISDQEDRSISSPGIQEQPPDLALKRTKSPRWGSRSRVVFLFVLILACIIIPSAVTGLNATQIPGGSGFPGPQVVHIGTYVVDFLNYNARDGTVETSFYVTLTSDRPVNVSDFEIMNGHANTIGLILDTPTKKYFRAFASLETEPDFHRFPFDRHTLPIIVEPRIRNTSDLIFVIDKDTTGIDPLAGLPGWHIGGEHESVANSTYSKDFVYSRVVFSYDISRDSFSTFLKFFLPVMLIIIVSLSSLLMKVTSRLGLNGSMLLAAVLIHWRIADAMPLVEYATFLDYFMIITYATLVMVLLSGILILVYNEAKNTAMIERINRWSVRIIPAAAIVLYALLFLTLWF